MKKTVITCDNCDVDVRDHARAVPFLGRKLDLCDNCRVGRSVRLADDPAEWPRFVKREDVIRYLDHRGVAALNGGVA